MSVEASAWAWDQPVKGTKKLLLLALANFADAEDVCWPSHERLAAMCGVERSYIRRTLTELVGLKYLERDTRQRPNGSQTSNHYRLTMRPEKGVRPHPGGVGARTQGGCAPAPTPEPSVDPLGKKSPNGLEESDPVAVVWACYVEAIAPKHTTLEPEERRIIREALAVASVDECCLAIQGCATSEFHMGHNDKGRTYNSIRQILKGKRGGKTTREQIDFMASLNPKSVSSGGKTFTSADPGRVSALKQDVLYGWTDRGNPKTVARGEKAKKGLAEMGVVIEYRKDDGYPLFP